MYAKKTKTLKTLVVVLSVILLMCLTVAGTLAYLQVQTGSVQNTFAPSNIDLTLTETTGSTYKMVPGVAMDKNPTVTVSGDVDAYVFVKIVEAGSVTVDDTTYTFDDFLSYAIDSGWTLLTGVEGLGDKLTTDGKIDTDANDTYVIYREVKVSDSTKTFSVLADNKVTTNASVTKQMMNAYTDESIKLTFTAYAIQMADGGAENNGNFTPAEAWAQAKQ